jgi:hypothetical protein
MRNRDLVFNKIERIEGSLKTLKVFSTRPNVTVEDIHNIITSTEETLSELKSMIEREPMGPNEMNRI